MDSQAFPRVSNLFGRTYGDDKIIELGGAGVGDPMGVSGADKAYVASFHAVFGSVDVKGGGASLYVPDFIVLVSLHCFVGRVRLLGGLVHLDADVSGGQQTG